MINRPRLRRELDSNEKLVERRERERERQGAKREEKGRKIGSGNGEWGVYIGVEGRGVR